MPSKRLPRDLDAAHLIRALSCLGYSRGRQVGSHVRLGTEQGGRHQETIPWHSPLKVGTLNAILSSIAAHHQLSRAELLELLDL
ncbi:MAG: type II toxin-antitoxin system HicA family toxin [Candidatus Hydrogenedentes bacterium]|nr:type II toxin-antitoxin system HicA family toxin [Candidatus Hydrogenedentota bacterium]